MLGTVEGQVDSTWVYIRKLLSLTKVAGQYEDRHLDW